MKPLLISLLLLYTLCLTAQSGTVIWQHGLESDASFWQSTAANFAVQRRITSVNRTVNTSNGILSTASNVVAATLSSRSSQTIGIGHSLGGVVFREMAARSAPGHVGGIITVGSPLNGAEIANKLINGQVEAYIVNGVNELVKGPLRESFGIGYIIVRIGTRALTGKSLQEVLWKESGIDQRLLEQANSPTVSDLQVNGSYMAAASQLRPTIPRISIFGSENSPVHYRLASTFSGKPDDYFPNALRDARGVYNTFYVKNAALFLSAINIWKAAGWKAGRDYIDHDSETGWLSLIGATRTESVRSCIESFTCDQSWYNLNCNLGGKPRPDCEDCWETSCYSTTRTYKESSDGLLNQSTQVGKSSLTISSRWVPDASFEVLGANHNEYNLHPNAIDRYNVIFDAVDLNPVFRRARR